MFQTVAAYLSLYQHTATCHKLTQPNLSCPCALTEHQAMKAYWGVEV